MALFAAVAQIVYFHVYMAELDYGIDYELDLISVIGNSIYDGIGCGDDDDSCRYTANEEAVRDFNLDAAATTEEVSGASHHKQSKQVKDGNTAKNINTVEDERPVLIMHIGPPKSGSTTLQNYFLRDNNQHVLGASNYTYLECKGVYPIYPSEGKDIEVWKPFRDCLESVRGKNILYSQEVFGHSLGLSEFRLDGARTHLENLQTITEGWRVIIVVSYRRYFEWFRSWYYQKNREGVRISPTWEENANKTEGTPIFPEYFRRMKLKNAEKLYRRSFSNYWHKPFGEVHPTQFLVGKFSKTFSDVVVFNIHEEPENIVANFYCNIMPNARQACEYRRKHGIAKENHNSAQVLDYDMLAIAAKEKGLLATVGENSPLERWQVSSAVKQRQEIELKKSVVNLPQQCLSKEEEKWYLKVSLQFEREILPEWSATARSEAEHRAKFDFALKKSQFCNVDTNAVLNDTEWHEFFTHLQTK